MEEVLLKGVVVDVEAEEMEEEAVDLLVGVVGKKKYEEPESCGSAADLSLGEEMEGDSTGRMEVEAGAHPLKIVSSSRISLDFTVSSNFACFVVHFRTASKAKTCDGGVVLKVNIF